MSNGNRIAAADGSHPVNEDDGHEKALSLMREALRLLDASHGPHEVCAHLDTAINRLRELVDHGEDAAG